MKFHHTAGFRTPITEVSIHTGVTNTHRGFNTHRGNQYTQRYQYTQGLPLYTQRPISTYYTEVYNRHTWDVLLLLQYHTGVSVTHRKENQYTQIFLGQFMVTTEGGVQYTQRYQYEVTRGLQYTHYLSS